MRELMLCNAIRGEFGFMRSVTPMIRRANADWPVRWLNAAALDAEGTHGLAAEEYAQFCSDKARTWIEQDLDDFESGPSRWSWWLGCPGNVHGCLLFGLQSGSFDDYQVRMLNFGFRLKALATLVWLRNRPDREQPVAAQLASRPDALRSPAREFTVSEDGNHIDVPLYQPAAGTSWRLPLPGSGRDDQPAARRR